MNNNDFLKEEVRSDFLVTEKRKKVWAKEIELMCLVLDLCKRHGIRVYASDGTVLGAVRHKGFIPWDDDIDLFMFRNDYDRFLQIAFEEIKAPYVVKNIYNTPYYNHQTTQISDSRTTAMPSDMRDLKYDMGIFIDIFPMDVYPQKLRDARKKIKRVRQAHHRLKTIQGILKLCPRWFYLRHRWDIAAFRKYEEVLRQPEITDTTAYVTDFSMMMNKILTYADLKEITYLPFEDVEIPVPAGYEHYLTTLYGDWKKPVKGDNVHGVLFFDPDKSYREYIKRKW